mgnify:CR=1 FL=1
MNLTIALKNGVTFNMQMDDKPEKPPEDELHKKMLSVLQEMLLTMPTATHAGGG